MRLSRLSITILLAFTILSWGQLGHRTIAAIAEKHLNAKAKQAVHDLIGDSSLSDIANWADEIRNKPEYKRTARWHYINLELGLSKAEFEKKVTEMNEPNVYRAILDMEQKLSNTGSSRDEKAEALRFIVHFVGDLHQPMHVSRAEDQGGNKIQVNYGNKGTNLHALWDSRLLEHEGLSDATLTDKIDVASPKQIAEWQKEPIIDWMWESYQISSQLYKEAEEMSNRTITDTYYQSHINILEDRLEKAGIRLAGLLNQLLSSYSNSPSSQASDKTKSSSDASIDAIDLNDIGHHIGERVSVCGKVHGEKEFPGMILINVGADYPNQLLTIVLKGAAKSKWTSGYQGNVCVKGTVDLYKGKPEIVISSQSDITTQ